MLVHSPLVGAGTMRPLAASLGERGIDAVVASLCGATSWRTVLEAAVATVTHVPTVIVGHSGAGPLLPELRRRLGPSTIVFLDAAVPPAAGIAQLCPDAMRRYLADLADARGMLPAWADWFDADDIACELPDPHMRAQLVAEMPQLPLEYFSGAPPVPEGWRSEAAAYVRLSAAYDDDADVAARERWPVVRLDTTHMAPVTAPGDTADALLAVTG